METQTVETRRPYRIVVFAHGFTPKREYKRWTAIEKTGYAYMGWNPLQSYQEARLPSAGSFLYPGIFAVRRAAMAELAKPEVHQVSIRTNQDRPVYRFFKQADGRITGYADGRD